jgi:hypothetical protein
MDPYEVLDTTIKIGLGATISAVSGYFLSRQSHGQELHKMAVLRRMDAFEKASVQTEEYLRSWRELTSTLGGMLGGGLTSSPFFSEVEWKAVREADHVLMRAKDQVYPILASLRLLGASEPVKHLNDINLAIGTFRDEMMRDHRKPSPDGFQEVRNEVGQLRKQFLSSLSKCYETF